MRFTLATSVAAEGASSARTELLDGGSRVRRGEVTVQGHFECLVA